VNLPTYCLQNKRKNFWIAEAKNRLRALLHSAESNSKIEYLREYEFIFKTTLAHESGDPGVLFAEKNGGSKISWDCPFKAICIKFLFLQSFQLSFKLLQKHSSLQIGAKMWATAWRIFLENNHYVVLFDSFEQSLIKISLAFGYQLNILQNLHN
jgi:hypothetical protein